MSGFGYRVKMDLLLIDRRDVAGAGLVSDARVQSRNGTRLKGVTVWLVALLGLVVTALPVAADRFEADLRGDRVWVGPEAWALPMQHWRVSGGALIGRPTHRGSVHLTSCELDGADDFAVSATLERSWPGADSGSEPAAGVGAAPRGVRVGFWLGTRGDVDDWRSRAVYPRGGTQVGVDASGRVFIGSTVSDSAVPLAAALGLEARYAADAGRLTVIAQSGDVTVELGADVGGDAVTGGVAMLAAAGERTNAMGEGLERWSFRDVVVAGPGVSVHRDRRFGPILWTQYTLSDGTLKLLTQMPPMGSDDAATVSLWFKRDGRWSRTMDAPIDADSRTALFRIDGWRGDRDVPYRVVYRWRGDEDVWDGVVRAEPREAASFTLAAFSCDNGYAFPQPRLTVDVAARDPDMLFFAGDQLYERFGGHGIQRAPLPAATLDYLRKWYLFGWTWRGLLRDRPTVVIPDDHDVFQGNLYGMGGAATPAGKMFDYGGYVMSPRWVNMVQRTQTGHLPDAVDPARTDSGIGVYFTAMHYAGLRFAILEDRKFKTGRGYFKDSRGIDRPWREMSAAELDPPGTSLLGDRQLVFLRDWAGSAGREAGGAAFDVVLTQTMFASVHTHSGPMLKFNAGYDLDTNGWPRSGRDAALRAMAPARPVLICGDQHLGALVRHGIDAWDDGPVQFMVTGTANGWPRAFWPGVETSNPEAIDADVEPLGRYTDPFGNRVSVLGVGNPEPRIDASAYPDRENLAAVKGSGYGLIVFDKPTRRVTFDLLRYPAADHAARSFDGFPVTLSVEPPENASSSTETTP